MTVKTIDNRDDRKQIVILLNHLTEQQRIAFLMWAVSLAPINIASGGKNPLKVVKSTPGKTENPFQFGSAEQVYFDLMMGVTQYAIPIDIVAAELEKRASSRRIIT